LCNGHENNGKLASIFASFYASTFEYNCFETRVKTFLKNSDEYIHQFSGKRLPWEDRSDIAIYIAAPDFPELNTQSIDIIEENLSYHGFTVNRPIKINGLVNDEMTRAEELSIYEKDVDLLNSSVLMVAILLNYDPGTLVEIGYFLKSNKPIILFDPTRVAKNMFLRNSVNCICYNINEITEKVFELASRGDNE
jgi:nucleoside 2-deoxyribosyltransferase